MEKDRCGEWMADGVLLWKKTGVVSGWLTVRRASVGHVPRRGAGGQQAALPAQADVERSGHGGLHQPPLPRAGPGGQRDAGAGLAPEGRLQQDSACRPGPGRRLRQTAGS